MYDYDLTGIIASTVNGEVTKYVKDPHGNVVVTSRNGSIVGEYDYSAFGKQLIATDTTNPFRYCGEYYDNENGLTYLRNRYYDSNTGRFLSEDPIKDGMNWYSYCGGDPVNAWDPSGYITDEEMQMYEEGKLSPGAYSYLMYCTYMYLLSDDDYSRNMWNSAANELRNNGYSDVDDGYWSNIIRGMSNRPSGGLIAQWEHYYRNNLNIEFSYDDLMKLNERLPDDMKWTIVIASFHQHHTVDGKDNVKYVSGCGHFEIVFNARNEVQNQYNNTDDMGTYNYYSPTNDAGNHTIYDVAPYYLYKNVPDAARRIP